MNQILHAAQNKVMNRIRFQIKNIKEKIAHYAVRNPTRITSLTFRTDRGKIY